MSSVDEESLERLQIRRNGHRAAINKLFQGIKEISDGDDTNSNKLGRVRTKLDLIQDVIEVVTQLDSSIQNATSDEFLEEEIVRSGDYHSDLADRMARIEDFIKSLKPPLAEDDGSASVSSAAVSYASIASALKASRTSKLPKLVLPTFSGDVLQWNAFWDSFNSEVHSDESLNDVNRFNYLRGQLNGEALKSIAGLTLTSANYKEALEILRERYGKPEVTIAAHFRALHALPQATDSLGSLKTFYDTMEQHIRSLETLGKTTDSYGSLLVCNLLDKLTPTTRRNMARDHGVKEWTLDELRKAIKKEIHILEAGQAIPRPSNKDSVDGGQYTVMSTTAAGKACLLCNESTHRAIDCQKFKTAGERMKIVQEKKLCFNCLSAGHRLAACRSRFTCHKCKKKHHTCLHDDRPAKDKKSSDGMAMVSSSPATSSTESTAAVQPASAPATSTTALVSATVASALYNSPPTVLLKTAVAQVSTKQGNVEANILFDEGSQRSFVTAHFHEAAGLAIIRHDPIRISSFGSKAPVNQMREVTEFKLVTDDQSMINVQAVVVPHITNPLRNRLKGGTNQFSYLKGLKLANPAFDDDAFQVDILIGADYYWSIVGDKTIRGTGPVAVESRLGFLLSGPSDNHGKIFNGSDSSVLFVRTEESFDLTQFWSIESLGIRPEEDAKDLSVNFKENNISCQDGRYFAKLPWKVDHNELDSNLNICQGRTRAMVRRLQKDPKIHEAYGKVIEQQLRDRFIEKVDLSSLLPGQFHVINHHPVVRESATTPVRIVFDCSCPTKNGISLNDCLDPGPPLQTSLLDLLLRFRLHPVGLISDIEKAFLQIQLDPPDRDYFCFLYPSDHANPESSFQAYRFRVLPFGVNCAPFILNAVVQKHLEGNKSPTAKDMLRNIYVDNLVTGCKTTNAAIRYQSEGKAIMASAGFNLKTWDSNDQEAFHAMHPELPFDCASVLKVLGLLWHKREDAIGYPETTLKPFVRPEASKRDVLKGISTIFDPLGFLSPVTIRAKILIQTLWEKRVTWDEPLGAELLLQWTSIANDVDRATAYKFQRRYFKSTSDPDTLIVFVDSSKKAYGAALYLCCGKETSLALAKSRVAPLKQLTLPQLELMAAVIGTNMADMVVNALSEQGVHLKTHFFSDSQIVLQWINNEKSKPVFIQNRVEKIRAVTRRLDAEWHYCPTEDNPADLLTRGITTDQLMASSLWKQGPSWTAHPEDWPKWKSASVLMAAEIETSPIDHIEETELNLYKVLDEKRYSSFFHLIRITALVIRFTRNCRPQAERKISALSAVDLKEAGKLWIKSVQTCYFKEEVTYLHMPRTTKRPATVRQLDLTLLNEIIVCGGRLQNANLPEESKHPILLPKYCYFTQLIIEEIHRRIGHGGVSATVAAIRETFWIPSARQRVRAILKRCVSCRTVNGPSYPPQDPAPLPTTRVAGFVPFAGTGIDLAGPFAIHSQPSSNDERAYIVLFTCTVSRAVHLEVVEDLSAKELLDALTRFANRRSTPKIIYSDNATNLKAAAEHLMKMSQHPDVSKFCCDAGIEWKFIVKAAPWYGGFWERLIGLMKTTLKKVLGRTKITLKELRTVITDVEATLNDRPLIYVSTDIKDNDPITPSHLLHGRRLIRFPITVLPEEMDEEDPTHGSNPSELTKAAVKRAKLFEELWSRFQVEYLSALREFHQTTKGKNEEVIKKGDVVLVHSDRPRLLWKMALVEELIRGADGKARAAFLRTENGRTSRPIQKLYPLEVRAAQPELIESPIQTVHKEIVPPEPDGPADGERTGNGLVKRPTRKASVAAKAKIKKWTTPQSEDSS